jgi:chemotaxis protein CheD
VSERVATDHLEPSVTAARTPAHKPREAAGEPERKSAFLHPGQVGAWTEPHAVTTILGSCVAVCLHDPKSRVGGMNHYLLPHPVSGERFAARFGAVAIDRLVERMLELHADTRHLQAKVFGGACIVGNPRGGKSLGAQNVELALACLLRRNIPVVAQDVEGARGRKLIFHSDDGVVWVRKI